MTVQALRGGNRFVRRHLDGFAYRSRLESAGHGGLVLATRMAVDVERPATRLPKKGAA